MPEFAVEFRGDPKRGEIPVLFGWPGRMHQIIELVDRWEGDEETYLRVKGEDGATYILRQNRAIGAWQIHFFSRDGEN